MWLRIVSACVLLNVITAQYYEVPEATVLALKPKGLHISIPDEAGVQLFAIHVNVNKPIANREAGQINQETRKSKNGRWVIEDPRVRLKPGDTLNYWLYVQVDDLGYPKDDITFNVRELVDPNQSIPPSQPVSPSTPGGCGSTMTTVNGRPACQGNMVFEETFDTLNINNWQRVVQFAGQPDFEFVVYTGNEKNSYVTNGKLHVKPNLLTDGGTDLKSGKLSLSGCTGSLSGRDCSREAQGWWNMLPPVESARISTKQSFSFRYGRIEVQAKLPSGDWIFPEIWLEPKTNTYGSNGYESGRIKLALVRGNRNLMFNNQDIGARHLDTSCVIGFGGIVHNEMFNRYNSGFWSDGFHTFGVTWTPDSITFSVDGQNIGTMTPPPGGFSTLKQFSQLQNIPWSRGNRIAPFDQEFYISIGLGAGGFTDFPDNCTSNNKPKPWKNKDVKSTLKFWEDKDTWFPTWLGDASILQVEHVKVWAL